MTRKRILWKLLAVCMLIMLVAGSGTAAFGAEGYEQIAGEGDMTSVEEVGVEGMFPIYGSDVEDGVYDVTVECSSSMFPVEKAVLTVEDGEMEAVLTMGGTGYLKLFLGSSQEAAAAPLSDYIDFVEDGDGKHTFTIQVEALDQPLACAAFSKNKEKWYDRAILFEAGSLPEGAVKVELPDYDALKKAARDKRIAALQAENEGSAEGETAGDGNGAASAAADGLHLKDGEYTVAVDLEGGTGRATIQSPATLLIKEGKAYARIVWSSASYDYMLVDGIQYLPINTEGNSTFEIPVTVFDGAMDVTADTTAMSTAHEIEYQLVFHADSIKAANRGQMIGVAVALVVIVIVAIGAWVLWKKRKNVTK